METIKLYLKLLGISLRAQMQHKASFFMLATAHFIGTFVDIVGIWVLFDRFKIIQGWTLSELALIYGIMHMGFALAEAFARGFDGFGQVIKNGDFDRLLLRPIGTIFQIATSQFQLLRIGRFLQGLSVFLWGFHEQRLDFFSIGTPLILLAIGGATSIFYGLFMIQATFCFWTTETLELMNIATYGGVETAQYPISIYKPSFRFLFTFLIPLACAAYYPVSALLQKPGVPLWMGFAAPFSGPFFLYVACQFWKLGVKRYHSTGS